MNNKVKVLIGVGSIAIVGVLAGLFVYKKKKNVCQGNERFERVDIGEDEDSEEVEEAVEEPVDQNPSVILTPIQQKAFMIAATEISSWHPSRDYLINDILVDMHGFTCEDASIVVDYVTIDWDEEAVMNAKVQMNQGASRDAIIEWLEFCKFNDAQIEKALKAVGY